MIVTQQKNYFRLARDDSCDSRGSASGGLNKPSVGGSADKPASSGKPGVSSASGGKGVRPGAKLSSAAGGGPKKAGTGEDVDSAPLYLANKLKNNRFRDEAKLKLLKWNFAAPRPEFVDQLKEQVL